MGVDVDRMPNFPDRLRNHVHADDLPQATWEKLRCLSLSAPHAEPYSEQELDMVRGAKNIDASMALLAAQLTTDQTKEREFFGALIAEFLSENGRIVRFACLDLLAAQIACASENSLRTYIRSTAFHGLLCQRVCHGLWLQDRVELAMLIHHSTARRSGVAIHPSVDLGHGIVVEDGGSIVVGEGARIGNNVKFGAAVVVRRSELDDGSPSPRISDGARLLAGARVLGPVTVGAGSTVAQRSVVLQDVPAYAVVRGNPAVTVGENVPDHGSRLE